MVLYSLYHMTRKTLFFHSSHESYSCMPQIFVAYSCMRQILSIWGKLRWLRHTEYAANICGIHEYATNICGKHKYATNIFENGRNEKIMSLDFSSTYFIVWCWAIGSHKFYQLVICHDKQAVKMFILLPTASCMGHLYKDIFTGREWTSLTKTALYKDILRGREWTSLTKTALYKEILRGREWTSFTKKTLYKDILM